MTFQPPSDDAYRQPVRSNVPALLLVGGLDPRTPVANATGITATLPRARVVPLENATHQFDLFGSSPIRQVLAQSLRGHDLAITRLALPPIPFVAGRPRESFRPLKGNNGLHFAH